MLMKLECVLGYIVNIHSPKKNSSNLHLIIQHSNYMARFELICLPRICILILLNPIIIWSKIWVILFFCWIFGPFCIYTKEGLGGRNWLRVLYEVWSLCIDVKSLYINNGGIFLKYCRKENWNIDITINGSFLFCHNSWKTVLLLWYTRFI